MSVDLAEREALATRNLQLAGEVRSKDARLAAFEAVEVDFTELGDQGVLMRRMMEGITHTLPCELCAVILIDEDAWSVAHARCEPHPAIAHAARGQGMRLAGSDTEAIRRGETIQLGMLRSCGIAALAGSALADVFDALSSPRAYKDPWPEERVLATIREDAGKAFDPELVEIFMERFDRIREIWRQHPDNAPPRA